jgi:hypothetical protein
MANHADRAGNLLERGADLAENPDIAVAHRGAARRKQVVALQGYDRDPAFLGNIDEPLGLRPGEQRLQPHRHRRAHGLKLADVLDADAAQHGIDRFGGAREREPEGDEQPEEHGQQDAADHPERYIARQWIALVLDTPPMRGKLALELAAVLPDQPIELVAHRRDLCGTVRLDLVLALESQRQAQVHHLEEVDVGGHVGFEAVENLEEFLATPGLFVERDQQRGGAPDALTSPGRAQHRLVQRGAQGITG